VFYGVPSFRISTRHYPGDGVAMSSWRGMGHERAQFIKAKAAMANIKTRRMIPNIIT
jgi:hypothetical protein